MTKRNVRSHWFNLRFGRIHVQSAPTFGLAHGYDSARGTRFWRYPFLTVFVR